MYKKENNYAFIDGQNLYFSTIKSHNPWIIDFLKFRTYLKDKYSVKKAFYFIGYFDKAYKNIYKDIRQAGFILIFKEHCSLMSSKKKGNVDSDIIFFIMKKLYKKEIFNKIILISGDGDYKTLIDFLIEENKLCKILFPSRHNASSLYKQIKAFYYAELDSPDIRNKINKNTPQ
jgi:uncharacterized LabA/DUF88 family protein